MPDHPDAKGSPPPPPPPPPPPRVVAKTLAAAAAKPQQPEKAVRAAPAPALSKPILYPFWFGGSASSMAACVTHPLDLGTLHS